MPPIWIKPHTARERAYKHALEKCGVSDKDATVAFNEIFRGFRDALQMHSLPDIINFELFRLKLSKFKLFLRILKYGIWLRNNIINKIYYIYLSLPLIMRFKRIWWLKDKSLQLRNDDALFMHNHYDRIMNQYLDDIKQYAENNNMRLHMNNDRLAAAEAHDEMKRYTKLIVTRNKRIWEEKK